MLSERFKEYTWVPWKFYRISEKWVESDTRKLFDHLAEELGIQTQSDWYTVKLQELHNRRMSSLIPHFDHLYKELDTAYPEFLWYPWLFQQPNPGYKSSLKNQRDFFEYVADELNIETQRQWYSVDKKLIEELGGLKFLTEYGNSLRKTLQYVFPGTNCERN
jgi:hypothetical protein